MAGLMANESLSAAAEKLLEQMQLVPPRDVGEPLRPIDEAAILELASMGRRRWRSPRSSAVIRAR